MNSATATPGRRRAAALHRVGWLAVASLVGLALAGPGAGIASATKPDDNGHKVTICHRTNSVTNPYTVNTVDYSSVDGGLVHDNGNGDHTNHLGPVFDTTVDPDVAYPPPHNGDQWGDIIPPFSWEGDDTHAGGSFPGVNWPGGQAIWANGCEVPTTTTTSTSSTSSTTTQSSSTSSTTTSDRCVDVTFTYSVSPGRHSYPLLSVTVTAPNGVPEGCERSWSLNSYTTQGSTWETSGTQALFDHDSITLDSENTSGTLTVAEPPCYGQTDFYEGTTRFDGVDGPLPHYPDSVVPNPGLIAYSNGGTACTTTTTTTSSTTTQATTTQATTTQATTTQATTTQATTTQATTTQATTTQATTTEGTVLGATGTPRITPPPTDALPVSGTPGGDSWRIALLAIAGLLATILLLSPATPATARRRR